MMMHEKINYQHVSFGVEKSTFDFLLKKKKFEYLLLFVFLSGLKIYQFNLVKIVKHVLLQLLFLILLMFMEIFYEMDGKIFLNVLFIYIKPNYYHQFWSKLKIFLIPLVERHLLKNKLHKHQSKFIF
jgi:hypothetical protein